MHSGNEVDETETLVPGGKVALVQNMLSLCLTFKTCLDVPCDSRVAFLGVGHKGKANLESR